MKFSAIIKDQLRTQRFVIPYRVYGNDGPHIICLNGVQQSMAMWHSFIRRFSLNYRIVLFDFPGQGKGHVTSGSFNISLTEEVNILHEVIKISGINNITFCSASWGGVVAMAFAEKYPHMVKRLILGSLSTKPNKRMIETIESGCRINSNNRKKIVNTLINSFGQNLPLSVKKRITNQFASMSQENLETFCKHGLFVITSKNLEDVVNFKKILAETVLLKGENDTIIDLDDVKYLTSQMPNCRMKIVPNVGHFLHLENDKVPEVYYSFLT